MILRNVGGLPGDVIPLNLTDRSSVPPFVALHLSEGGSEGGLETEGTRAKPGNWLVDT